MYIFPLVKTNKNMIVQIPEEWKPYLDSRPCAYSHVKIEPSTVTCLEVGNECIKHKLETAGRICARLNIEHALIFSLMPIRVITVGKSLYFIQLHYDF